MFARVVSGILLSLGVADLGALNLVLAPRLAAASADAALAAAAPARPCVPPELPAREARAGAPDAVVWAASLAAAPAARPAMPDVTFAFDSTGLDHLPAIHDLRRMAQELGEHPGRRLLLRGHSDPLGFADQNLDLSRRRADAVKDYLVLRGAPADRIAVEGLGPSEPADPLRTPAARARDRRVEILWK
jgi:outer membrane protein OmpA-like peptidoglycan-associated protein